MMRKVHILLVCLAALAATGAGAQGTIHGNGDPRSQSPGPNCAQSRFYVDEATGTLYQANQGSPCVWALAPASVASGAWNRRGTVVAPDPVIANACCAGEPTVIASEANPKVLTTLTKVWKMWYTIGTNICYAESPDGVSRWTRYTGGGGTNGCLMGGSQSNVIENAGTYYLFVNNRSTGIDEYTATDGVTFTKVATIITGSYNNTGGVFYNNTLYLFVEGGSGGISLWTSPAPYTTFTYSGNSWANFRGPSAPFYVNGKWWMWVHIDQTNVPTCGPSNGSCDVIERISAPDLTGPWTNSETGYDLYPQVADEQGDLSFVGQTADPYVLEFNNKTYLYYSATDDSRNMATVKLAIADLPLASLVQTQGGPQTGTQEASDLWGVVTFNPNPAGVQGIGFGGFNIYGTKNVTASGTVQASTFTGTSNAYLFGPAASGQVTYLSIGGADDVLRYTSGSTNLDAGFDFYGGLYGTVAATGAGGHGYNVSGGRSGNDNYWFRNQSAVVAEAIVNNAYGNASVDTTKFDRGHVHIFGAPFAQASQSAIASAATIAPTTAMFHVSGTTQITTITPPAGCTYNNTMCQITMIPDGLFTTGTSGNIALATTAVVSKALTMTYDPTTGKWYPSY